MNIEELYSKYVGERYAWVKYYEANVTDIPFTEREIYNYRKDGVDMPDGHTHPGLPKPKNFEEAWEQFVKHKAQMVFEMKAEDFLKKYRGVTVGVLECELDEINEFIARAKATIKTSTAFADRNSFYGPKPNYNSYEEEYIRLSNGYYDSRYDELKERHCAGYVYGGYFIFRCWLEEQLQTLQAGETHQANQTQRKFPTPPQFLSGVEEPEPEYLLPMATLQKIHDAFDGELWTSIKLNTFYSLFDINSTKRKEFKVLKKVNFYALLWKMHNAPGKHATMEQFIRPFLERYSCSYNVFGNIRKERINSTKPLAKKLMKRIEEAMQ